MDAIMDFIGENWFYLMLLALFVGIHFLGPGVGSSQSQKHSHEKSFRNSSGGQ